MKHLLKSRNLPLKARDLLKENHAGLPVWVRAPKSGTEHYTGFGRGKLYELDSQRLIRSVSIRQPGQIRGTRLFDLQSILDYIEQCCKDSAPTPTAEDSQG